MFRYINMPKLVAFYLREFCLRKDDAVSNLYKFVFCLCLPFVSAEFRRVRLIALAIAECTNSKDQITKVLKKITGADMVVNDEEEGYFTSFDGTDTTPVFPFDNSDSEDNPIVFYGASPNIVEITITLNGASRNEVEAYLELLLPFYINATINYV